MIKLENSLDVINLYLDQTAWLKESVTELEKPGEGNMNFTLRIKSETGKTYIIKQSRDYVEKYPEVPAPPKRVLEEAKFYQLIQKDGYLASRTPAILEIDRSNHIILMEDLGESNDYTNLYKSGNSLSESELKELMHFAAHLHNNFKRQECEIEIPNREMRKLNHEHIFLYPYMENNGLDLDSIQPGLGQIASEVKKNEALKTALKSLGDKYLADGESLLHGDYFPGSWLRTNSGLKVIDPEFCFFGPAEFEVGVCLAHLYMANQPKDLIGKAMEFYKEKAPLDDMLMMKYMAVEMLRRILGLAQLPLELSLEEKEALVERGIMIITQS